MANYTSMIVYLDGNKKFHLYSSASDVIFMHYNDSILEPAVTQVRWKSRTAFTNNHIEQIIEKLKSDDEVVKALGVKMLEQSLKVKIYGRVVGYYEGTPI